MHSMAGQSTQAAMKSFLKEEYFMNIGTYLKTSGQLDEAIKMYDMAIQENPSYPLAYYNRGKTYCEISESKSNREFCNLALLDLKNVLKYFDEPPHSNSHRSSSSTVADINMKPRNTQEEVIISPPFPESPTYINCDLSSSVDNNRIRGYTLYYMGRAYANMAKLQPQESFSFLKQAVEKYEEVLQIDFKDEDALFKKWLALLDTMICLAQKQPAEAKRYYTLAMEEYERVQTGPEYKDIAPLYEERVVMTLLTGYRREVANQATSSTTTAILINSDAAILVDQMRDILCPVTDTVKMADNISSSSTTSITVRNSNIPQGTAVLLGQRRDSLCSANMVAATTANSSTTSSPPQITGGQTSNNSCRIS